MPPEDDKVSTAELDRVLKYMEKHTDTLTDMIQKNTSTTEEIGKQVALLDSQMKETRQDIGRLDGLIRGNGQMGLKTKTELLEAELKGLGKRVSSVDEKILLSKVEKTKKRTAIEVAIISGSLAGLVALGKIIIGLLL